MLDVACGTGTSSEALASSGATVVGVDFSKGMIASAAPKAVHHPNLSFQVGDATQLKFADNSFDVVTISFGLRNVQNVEQALTEFLRVLRPGGRLLIQEFSTPGNTAWRGMYRFHMRKVAPVIARAVSSNTTAYDYLADSIEDWPNQDELAKLIRKAGFKDVAWRNLTGGIVAMHRGVKPVVKAAAKPAAKKPAAKKPAAKKKASS